MTLDNGKEFAAHAKITEKLGTKVFFADPYSSWQRGLNEQVNSLGRQTFKRKRIFLLLHNKMFPMWLIN